MKANMRPLLIYQAPFDWDALWNRAQPLAKELSAHVDVLYLGCHIRVDTKLGTIISKIPKIRGFVANALSWWSIKNINKSLNVLTWQSSVSRPGYLYYNDHGMFTYYLFKKWLKNYCTGRNNLWLLTSKPNAQGLINMLPWTRIGVDVEDPWLDWDWDQINNKKRDLLSENIKVLFKRASFITSNGEKMADSMKHLTNKDIFNISNGIDDTTLDKMIELQNCRSKNKKNDGELRIVYVGSVDKRINFKLLNDVAIGFPMCRIFLVGPINESMGNQQKNWEYFKTNPNVTIAGPVGYSEVPFILSNSNVLIIPYNREIGVINMLPSKVLEYISSGNPVVSTIDYGIKNDDAPNYICDNTENIVPLIRQALDYAYSESNNCYEKIIKHIETKKWSAIANKFLENFRN